jgi:hypothetical protein
MMKNVVKIDVIVVVVSLVVLMGLVGYARPLVIAPIDDFESSDGNILFSFERADALLVDDNLDFTTPDEYRVVDGEKIKLEPGVYYWKVSGVLGSEIRKLTIKSRVELELVEIDEGMAVVNSGNVRLNVDVYDGDELVEKRKLEVGEVSGEGDKFIGGYDE